MASAMVTEQENTLDGIGNPVLVFQPGTDMSEVFAGIQTQQLTQLVRTSAALGWSLAELLGRCYQLKDEAVPVRDDVWNGTKLKALKIPNPPLADQTRIVAEVERRLSVVEELDAVVSANLQRATRLRQSVL